MNAALIWKILISPWTAIALLAIAGGIQTGRLNAAQARFDSCLATYKQATTTITTAIGINKVQQQEITNLAVEIRKMISDRMTQQAERERIVLERDSALRRIEVLAANEKVKRDAMWKATQRCETLGAIDLGGVCPDIADRLRARSVAAPGNL